jgi:hypothetical protein
MNNDMNNNMNTAYAMRQLTKEFKINIYDDNVKQLYSNIRESAKKGKEYYDIPDDIARNLNLEYYEKSTCQIYEELKLLGYNIKICDMTISYIRNMTKSYCVRISW